ncbi:MAG: flavin reductase [Erysipelotrichaceae bacterium]|nr:flavin reductase [Erysipelotrichaceae bacterium]
MLINPFEKFSKDWALVTAGDKDSFNSMTIAWGAMGTIWNKSVVTIYIRPDRYTFSFLEKNDYFTVSFYPESCRDTLRMLGTKSGRDSDKIKESGLTPVFLKNGITYREAYETFVCRKIYCAQMKYEDVPEEGKAIYQNGITPHYIIMGEVVNQ